MYKYLKVSESHFISLENGKLYNKSIIKQPNTIYYPPYLDMPKENSVASFDFKGNSKLALHQNYSEVTDTVKLNQLWIKYTTGLDAVEISFYDYRSKKKLWVRLNTKYTNSNFSAIRPEITITHAGGSYQISYEIEKDALGKVRDCVQFPFRTPHPQKTDKQIMLGTLNVGLVATQYTIRYRDVVFGGTSYAFIDGCWGILLGDDLSIEAIFSIQEIKDMTISVASFIWSTNPYIAKQVLIHQGGK